ncbi:MAG: LysR family transcriptional regulator [Rhodobacteraceae bacterium]|nr:LysR family transcriptional regulator [Paracoccaceae bacterium]
MNIRQLTHFLAALEHGSLVAAAEQLNLSQPALSKSIATLESQFGQDLFVRLPRGLRLTAAGRALERHARRILQDLEAARSAVALVGAGGAGRVAVGVGSTFLAAAGSAVLEVLAAADAEFDVMTDHANNLKSALLANRIDLYVGMCNHLEGDPAFDIDYVFTDAFTGVCVIGHPFAGKLIAPGDCLRYDWVVPQLEETVRKALEAYFIGQGLPRPRFRIATNADQIIATCLRDSTLLSIAPEATVGRGWLEGLEPFKLAGFDCERRVGIVRRANASLDPLGERFSETLRSHIHKMAPDRSLGHVRHVWMPPAGQGT